MDEKTIALKEIENELTAIRKTLQDIAYIMDQRWH